MEIIQAILNELNLTKLGFIFGIISIIFIIINLRAIINQNKTAIRSERNERFKNAIDQLGNDNNAVVLGGIYTLHRVAKEDKSYRENVFNILCSFVRDVTITDEYKERYKEKPSEPIQTILNILCINKDDFNIYKTPTKKRNILTRTALYKFYERLRPPKNKFLLDFYSTYLVGANLANANLKGANLLGANLSKANLTGANLFRTTLTLANLKDANLTDTNLNGVNLTGAILFMLILVMLAYGMLILGRGLIYLIQTLQVLI